MQAMLYCQACGSEAHDKDKNCPVCMTKIDHSLQTQDPLPELPSVKTSTPENDVLAGTFCLVGGALVAVGSFLPYVVATTVFGISISRNAFQLGQNLSMTYDGPLILVAGLLLVFRGLNLKGTLGSKQLGTWSPIWISILAALVVLSSWLSTFPVSPAVTFSRGYGGIVSLVGALSGFVAVYIRRRNS